MPGDPDAKDPRSGVASEPSTILVTVPGDLRRTDIQDFCEEVSSNVQRTGASRVLVDASNLTRPGIGVLEALVRLRMVARRLRRDCVICAPTPQLTVMLSLLGLDTVLDIDIKP
jgi:anti-anti-sigma regulatory factor